ncbi:ABC transporter permease [Streptomyces sp. NPDC091416]|uniref:ABC transporter permease n=1 Tax=Streptomyces sp. NPDC091416 TaxID=3366003 RepID=UPI00380F1EBB
MSTITTTTPPRSAPSGAGLRGPVRVLVLQHRRALWTAGALALAGVVLLTASVWWNSGTADTYADTGCSYPDTSPRCLAALDDVLSHQAWLRDVLRYVGTAMMVLPAAIGVFVAGPMIGRELESGTYRLAWSQSVSPTRWLLAKLTVPAAITVVAVPVLSAVYAWCRTSPDTDRVAWYDTSAYAATGTLPTASALLAIAIGALAALLVRRTLLAMSITALAYGAVALTLGAVRSSLWPVRTVITPLNATPADLPGGTLFVGSGLMTGEQRLPGETCYQDPVPEVVDRCLADHHITGIYTDFHPASHFWPLQLVATGIVLVLAAAAVALAFRVLRRRHA